MDMKNTQPFVKIPSTVVFAEELLPMDIRVYLALRSYRKERISSTVWPSRKTLAKRLKCSVITIDRSIKRLCAIGCLGYIKGSENRTNIYQFYKLFVKTDSIMCDAIPATPMRLISVIDDGYTTSPTLPKPESSNQNHKPEYSLRLYHGKDIASVGSDGSIRIQAHHGGWVNYGGGDEGSFRFGELQGSEARKAAVRRFAVKPDTILSLPTSEQSSSSSRPTDPPFDNLNHD